jgi:hypothetical protein
MKTAITLLCIVASTTLVLGQGVWERQCVDSSGNDKGAYLSLAIDSKDDPHAAYLDWDFHQLRYAHSVNGVWSVQVIDSVDESGEYCQIVLDPKDRPHICYYAYNRSIYNSLKYATLTDSGWVTMYVDSSKDQSTAHKGQHPSIAIIDKGYPCIASYSTQDGKDCVEYFSSDSLGWHKSFVKEVWVKFFVKLLLKDGHTPIVAFTEYSSAQSYSLLQCAVWDEGARTWNISTVDDSAGGYGAADIDQSGILHFTYSAEDGQRYATFDPLTHQSVCETLPYLNDPAYTIKVSRTGQVAIVASNWRGVSYLLRTAGGWNEQIVDDDLYGGVDPISLAFDNANNPHILGYGRVAYPRIGTYAPFYFRFWPGAPQMVLPSTAHDFGNVWTQGHADWDLTIENHGTAPLIIWRFTFESYPTAFEVPPRPLPVSIRPNASGKVTLRFTPTYDSTYHDVLRFTSKDSVVARTPFAVQGTGTSSGTTGDITVKVLDCSFDTSTGTLKTDFPRPGVEASLYQTGTFRYGPLISDSNGEVRFTGVAVGDYDVQLRGTFSNPYPDIVNPTTDTLRAAGFVTVGPGSNSADVSFPATVIQQKYSCVYQLSNLTLSYGADTTYHAAYGAEQGVDALLKAWGSRIPGKAPESTARLILAENVAQQFFPWSRQIYSEFISDISELINFLFYPDEWADRINKVFGAMMKVMQGLGQILQDPFSAIMNLLVELAKYFLLDALTEAIQQASAELPCFDTTPKVCGGDIVMAAWHAIRSTLTVNPFIPAGVPEEERLDQMEKAATRASWDRMKNMVWSQLYNAVFEVVYIDLLTNPSLNRAREYSRDFRFNGDLKYTYSYYIYYLDWQTSSLRSDLTVCSNLREAAGFLNIAAGVTQSVATLAKAVAAGTPAGEIVGPLNAIAQLMRLAACFSVATAVGISGYAFFDLPDNMGEEIDNIYGQESLAGGTGQATSPCDCPRSGIAQPMLATLQQGMQSRLATYDSSLTNVMQLIQAGKRGEAVLALEGVATAEKEMVRSVKLSCAPIYGVASAARDSIPSFRALYDTMRSQYLAAALERYQTLVFTPLILADSGQDAGNTIAAQLQRNRGINRTLVDQVAMVLDTVSVLPAPAIVAAAIADQDVYEIKQGKSATIRLQLQNLGALPADNVSIVVRTNPAIKIVGGDSIFVGTLQPLQKSSVYERTVQLGASGYSRGIWTATIVSTNARTYSASGSFTTPSVITPGTGGRLAKETMYNYPNPFNPEQTSTTLRYSLSKTAQVNIRIYDAGGILVKTLVEGMPMNAGDEQATPWDGRNGSGTIVANGVYFYVVESTAGERAVGKIAVIR